MVLGILFIGLCVSFLRLSQFGVDPFSAMNLGISGFIGWSFGTWQLLVNAIILVVVFFQARSCIGAGTIINMVFVGYIADFICYVANDVVQIQMNLPLRILALLLAQLMASMGVALYMVADMGIAPYDSVAIIIEKLTHQKIPFHKARDPFGCCCRDYRNHICHCIWGGNLVGSRDWYNYKCLLQRSINSIF